MDEVDPEGQAKRAEAARAAEAAAHEGRLAEQLKAADMLQAENARVLGLQAGVL